MLAMAIEDSPALAVFSVWMLGSYFVPLVFAAVVALFRPRAPNALGTFVLGLGAINTVPMVLVWLPIVIFLGPNTWMVALLLIALHIWAWRFVASRLVNPPPLRPVKSALEKSIFPNV